MIYKFCRRCGRPLKGAENRERGYGKTCFLKSKAETEKALFLLVPLDTLPIEVITEQSAEESKEQEQSKGKAESKAEQSQAESQSKAQSKAKGRGKNFSKREEARGAETPHLEKTLTPTRKNGVLFTPHTHTPSPI